MLINTDINLFTSLKQKALRNECFLYWILKWVALDYPLNLNLKPLVLVWWSERFWNYRRRRIWNTIAMVEIQLKSAVWVYPFNSDTHNRDAYCPGESSGGGKKVRSSGGSSSQRFRSFFFLTPISHYVTHFWLSIIVRLSYIYVYT